MNFNLPERFPAWVEDGERTEVLIRWLLQEEDHMLKLEGYSFVKARTDDCLLLYSTGEQRENIYEKPQGLMFCGIFNPSDYSLYDVGKALRDAAGIPDDMFFPGKQDVQAEAQSAIQKYGAERIKTDWYTLLAGSRYTTRQLLPKIDRAQIRSAAEQFYLEGKTAEDIVYEPQFVFGSRMGQFTDESYLLYLNHKECVVRSFAERWLKRELARISHERITYGCIRDEMREIVQDKNDRIHKVRQLMEAVSEESGSVRILAGRKGKLLESSMQAEELQKRDGYYPISALRARERKQAEAIFGNSLRIEDIRQISVQGRVLYPSENIERKTA